MRKCRLLKAAFLIALAAGPHYTGSAAQPTVPGTVYLVVGSDTAIWNGLGTVDVYTRHPYYLQDSFTDSNAPIYQVMDPAWRGQFKDSFGQLIKFTWWMMGGNIYRDASNLNVPLANTMTLHLMKKYHGAALRQFGDELSLHYHTYAWSDYSTNGAFYWNQTPTFNDCLYDFDLTLAQYLLEENVFPASFRSGWHFMDQPWQQHLNGLIPYSFHDNYPAKVAWATNSGPLGGVEDWSRAPTAFVPFHPSTNDYQLPGDSPGWNVRSVKIQWLTQALLDQMFAEASNGVDQVVCFWDHLPENFVANIARLGSMLSVSVAAQPKVAFRYCTAVEAMQRWRQLTNSPPVQLGITEDLQGPTLRLVITSSVPVFQPRPLVAVRDARHRDSNFTWACQPAGSNTWTLDLGVPTNLLAKVAVAVTDLAGNVATRTLRYLPDDLYLDNLDAQYTETQGNWTSSTNAAWGINARVMPLASTSTARVNWSLPVTWRGRYRVFVQVPAVPNPATNVLFNLWAGASRLYGTTLPSGIPAAQWAYVASLVLDPGVSNRIEMVTVGANQAGSMAVADVLRLVAVSEAAEAPVVNPNTAYVSSTAGGYLLRFAGESGKEYAIQKSSGLGSGWLSLQVASPLTPGILEYIDPENASPLAFYRVLTR